MGCAYPTDETYSEQVKKIEIEKKVQSEMVASGG